MKSQLFIFVLLLYCTTLVGQQNQNPKQVNLGKRIDSTHVTSVDQPEAIESRANNDTNTISFLENSIPWIVALLISILSVGYSLKVSKNSQLSNDRKIQLLIESNERNLKCQIDKSLDLYIQNLRLSVASNNKQDWLNEVRMCISNYMTNITFLKPEVKAFHKGEDFIIYVEKVLLYKSKAEILLTEQNCDEKEVLRAINEFSEILTMSECDYDDDTFIERKSNLLLATRNLFKNHQRKIRYNT
jgi:hypothetical protein